jgi:hypothetical protein
MEVLYVTDDEVHRSLAEELALGCGARLWVYRPEAAPPEGLRFDVFLYDLDAVGHSYRPALLSRVFAEGRGRPRGVHGYEIADEQIARFRRHGIAVAQRLQAELLWRLCRAARQRMAAIPPDDAVTDETWITLDA